MKIRPSSRSRSGATQRVYFLTRPWHERDWGRLARRRLWEDDLLMAMRWLAGLAVCLVTSACTHAHPGAQLPSSLRQQILTDADRAAHANRTNAVRVEVVRTTFVEASRFMESAQPEPVGLVWLIEWDAPPGTLCQACHWDGNGNPVRLGAMEWAYSDSGQKIGDSSVLARHQNLNQLGRVTVLRH
jgi:hypothetical protein